MYFRVIQSISIRKTKTKHSFCNLFDVERCSHSFKRVLLLETRLNVSSLPNILRKWLYLTAKKTTDKRKLTTCRLTSNLRGYCNSQTTTLDLNSIHLLFYVEGRRRLLSPATKSPHRCYVAVSYTMIKMFKTSLLLFIFLHKFKII